MISEPGWKNTALAEGRKYRPESDSVRLSLPKIRAVSKPNSTWVGSFLATLGGVTPSFPRLKTSKMKNLREGVAKSFEKNWHGHTP